MGWYLKKAFKIGPFLRLNLSKSGVGFSFGVKGARIGRGPRGTYVAAGREGIYYRQSLKPRPGLSLPSEAHPSSGQLYCTQCGSSILPGNQFCNQCGAHLVAGTDASPTVFASEEKHDHYLDWFVVGAAVVVVAMILWGLR